MSTRCVAPVRTTGGVMSCVMRRDACHEPTHRRWDRLAPLLDLVWRIKPWWPNKLGRAQDRGKAHVCPNIHPCRPCQRGEAQ